jgi:membrane protein
VVLLTLGPVLVGISVSVTTYLHTLSVGMDRLPPEAQPYMLKAVPIAVSTVAFFLAYRIVPHRQVPWRHALTGGVIAALLFEAMKDLFAHYIAFAPTYNLVYGTFAAIPLFLLWVYLSWLVILFGAEVTASAGYWHGRMWKRAATPGSRFRDAIALGRLLVAAKGEPVAFEALCRGATVPADQLEDALGHLMDAGIVRRTAGAGYALARPSAEITLGDLYRAAVSRGARMEPEDWAGYSPEIVTVIDQFEALLDRPLNELLDK